MDKIGHQNNVSFKAGYGNDYRNTDEKYERYGDIDTMMKEYTKKNDALTERVNAIRSELASLVKSYQSIPDMDKEATEAKIQEMKTEMEKLKNEIEDNKDFMRHMWYDHHERL